MKREGWLLAIIIMSVFFQIVVAQTQNNLTYDGSGNLIQGFGKYYEYDNFNQVKTVRQNNIGGSLIAEYFYDHEGIRIKKIEYGITNTTTYYIDENFIQIVNSTGKFNTTYYYLEGDLVARKDNDQKKFYYHPDQLSSTSLVTNQSGSIVEEEFYLPYGETLEGNEKSRYLFTGKEKEGTDLYYYGSRYYDPFTKRFTQPDNKIQDIYNPQDLNRYSYARNNPYKYNDPSGNAVNLVTGAVGAVSGGVIAASFSIVSQLYSTGQISWTDVGKSSIAGTVGGGVFGLTLGIGTAVLGASTLGELSIGSTAGLFGLAGATEGVTTQATLNSFYDRPLTENVAQAGAFGAVVSGGTAGLTKGVSSLLRSSTLSKTISFSDRQLQAKFKHASDFGVGGNYNKQNALNFKNAIQDFVSSKETMSIEGTYRDNPGTHFYNPKTNQWAFKDTKGEFVTGFKLGENQAKNLKSNKNVR